MIDETAVDRLLRQHFAALADASIIDGQADRALARNAAISQRPAWLVAVRGSSTGLARQLAPDGGGRRMAMVLAVGLLVVVAVALAIVGAQRRIPTFGNGLLAISRDGDILLVDAATGEERRVVADEGLTFTDPIWSPDGRYILIREDGGASYVLDLETQDVRHLGHLDRIAWSSDGSHLAAQAGEALLVIEVTSGAQRTLVTAGPEGAPEPLDWSPNGRWLLAGGFGRDLVRIDAASGDSMILVPSSQSSSAIDAQWSPDGDRIVITHRRCPSGDADLCPRTLVIIGADGTEPVDLTDGDIAISNPHWSPNQAWIAFTSAPETEIQSPDQLSSTYERGLSIVRSDGSEGGRLVAERVVHWTWSPDGESILYALRDTHDQRVWPIWRFDLATGGHQNLGITSEEFAWQPIRSGAAVPVLPSGAPAGAGGTAAIGVPSTPAPGDMADPTGSATGIGFAARCKAVMYSFGESEPRSIAAFPACPRSSGESYAWAPDGSAIIGMFDETATVIARNGTTLAELSTADTYYTWSPGGHFIVERRCGEVTCREAILRPNGSERTELPGRGWWSANDGRLAVVDRHGRLLVGSGDASSLAPTGIVASPDGPVSWAPDGSRLAFVRDGNAWTAGADGADQRPLTDFQLGGVNNVSWSPDGRWVVVLRGTTLWIAAVEGSREPRRVAVPDTFRYLDVVWAPDGERFAVGVFPARGGFTPDRWERTFIVSADDGAAIELVSAMNPAWSPDGRFLAVTNTTDVNGLQIDVLNADGSGRHTIPTGEFTPDFPAVWIP